MGVVELHLCAGRGWIKQEELLSCLGESETERLCAQGFGEFLGGCGEAFAVAQW